VKAAVCIISVSRQSGQTLGPTLERMRSSDDLASDARFAVSVGDPDSKYAEEFGTELLLTNEETWEAWGGEAVHRGYHLTRNTLRAHRWLAKSGADLCVFAEDDVAVCKGWLRKLGAASELARSVHRQAGVTACSSHPQWCFQPPLNASPVLGVQVRKFVDPNWFWGNQLLAYGPAGARAMSAHIQRCVARWRPPLDKLPVVNSKLYGDQATKTFFSDNDVPLYATNPSLGRHSGEYRTWSGPEHVSPAFRDHPTARFEEPKP
jgi:hypothetical protein